ncbi:hypothetical protein ACFQZZ_33110 [Nocardia sp. GCM10030253]|uniref:hypothetical protein n=1 Tax=Nocardia sp. GCM10030253 TaxID=3273404 RepID=UPI003626A3A7
MATTRSLAMYQLIAMTQQEAHQPPSVPFTVEQAHLVMQFHVACRATCCPRKAAAQNALIEAGCMVLSATKPR